MKPFHPPYNLTTKLNEEQMFVSATTMLIPLVRKFGNYESDKMRVEMLNDEKGNEAMDLISTLAIENHNKACDVGRSMLRMSISPENNLPTLSEDRLSILASGPPSLPPSPAVSKSTTAHYFLDGSGVPPLPPPSTTHLDLQNETEFQKPPKTYEGWLYKGSGKGFGYKKRYFVLSENQFCYRNEKNNGVSTRCFLKMAILNPLPEDFPSKTTTEFKFRVQIQQKKKKKSSTRMFYLCADTQIELDVWLFKFQEHIAYANMSSMKGSPLPPSATYLLHCFSSDDEDNTDSQKIPKPTEGWLYKSNGKGSVYKKRYIVLSKNQFYYRNKQKKDGISTRCFLKMAILNPLPEDFPSKPKTEFKFRVQIQHKKKKRSVSLSRDSFTTRMFYLCTDTQEELDLWLLKFQEHIEYANMSATRPGQHDTCSKVSINGPPVSAPSAIHQDDIDDNEDTNATTEESSPPVRNIGDEVEVEIDEGEYYTGVITFVNHPDEGALEEVSYDILFDDGDHGENVLENELRQETESSPSQPIRNIGDQIEVEFDEGEYYKGVITFVNHPDEGALEEVSYDILFDDGDHKEDVMENELRQETEESLPPPSQPPQPPPPQSPPSLPMRNIGDQIEVEFDEGEYYKGVITFVNHPRPNEEGVFGDGSYDILFDDGDHREDVLENELRQEPEELLPPPLASNGGLEMNRFIFVKKKNSSILLLNTNPTPPTLPLPLPENLPPPPQPPSIA